MNKTLMNLTERTFYLKGDKTLSPRGTVEVAAQDADYVMALYPGELAIAGETLVAPAPVGNGDDYTKMSVQQLKEALAAAGIAIPDGAKKPELIALAQTIVKEPAAPAPAADELS